ncbi:MAG: HlyC/CorC family transporter [Rikenellaceae bacterium]|nr:HlyC/CorC family transporter [Rikenellaceae bacterium]
MLTTIAIILISLLFSAFFSGMEIAFVASNKLKLELEKKQSAVLNYILGIFTRHPGQYISTILVGNNIALVVYSLNMTVLFRLILQHYNPDWQSSVLLETIVSTVIIIFTAEFLPKALVRGNPNFYLNTFAVPVYLFYLVLFPISKLATWLSIGIFKLLGLPVRREHGIRTFDRVELSHLLEEVSEHGEQQSENENEIKLFQNALDFSDLRVRDCMVPRIDVEAVPVDMPVAELTRRFSESQYSRIFVYHGSIDNIIGYVTTKSLFTHPGTIRHILKQALYTTESMPAQKLLTLFTKRNQSVAVVIDEFGGTAGIVSLEDVLEEIFGEIEDEHDRKETVEKKLGENEYIFSCRLEVEYLNEAYGLHIPESEEYDTLAGYIIFRNDGIPTQGETIVSDSMRIKVLRVSGSKLELARLTLL